MGGSGSKKDPKEGAEFNIPSGLYQSLHWDLKVVKRLITSKRLAPLFPGKEESLETQNGDYEECPICFLFYPGGLNRSTCCKKGICTECFLQIKRPNNQAYCPFCQRSNYMVVFSGPLTKEEKEKDIWEQQQVLEAKIRMRKEEIEEDNRRELRKRESSLSNPISTDVSAETFPSSSSPSNGMEFFSSQSLPAFSPLSSSTEETTFSSYSTSYPPPPTANDMKRREVELEDIMLQEAMRLSLMRPDNGSDTDNYLSDDGESKNSEMEEANTTQQTANDPDDLELALALALSLQNVIK